MCISGLFDKIIKRKLTYIFHESELMSKILRRNIIMNKSNVINNPRKYVIPKDIFLNHT